MNIESRIWKIESAIKKQSAQVLIIAGDLAWYASWEEVAGQPSFVDTAPDDKKFVNPSDVPHEVERIYMLTWADQEAI